MGDQSQLDPDITRVMAEPGICGFSCVIEVQRKAYTQGSIKVIESECKQIQRLSKDLKEISLTELFKPITQNPAYLFARRAGCHPSCPIPMAILKAIEVAMDMALPRDVVIKFEPCIDSTSSR